MWRFKNWLKDWFKFTYDNKSTSEIREDVKKEFKKIEKSKTRRYRDDQEIYEAWIKVIDNYIRELKNASGLWVNNKKWGVKNWQAQLIESANLYRDEALAYFKAKRDHFDKRWSKVLDEKNFLWTWCYITSSESNRQQIQEVASAINEAEEEALKRIKLVCNVKQGNDNAVEESSVVRDSQWNVKVNREWTEVVRQKPMFTADSKTWLIKFTDRSNPVKIHDALKWLFKGNNIVYEIDYTNCTNPNIKQKMMQLTWWEVKCLITYNKEKWTYLIRNSKWETRENRALIWEGVTLKRDELRQWDAREKKKAQNAKLWEIDYSDLDWDDLDPNKNLEDDERLKPMINQMPNELKKQLKKLWNKNYLIFIIETERRLNTILKKWKAEWYELHVEPVTKVWWWLMEIHFVNDYTEKDVTVWDDNTDKNREDAGRRILWSKLYNTLDSNQDLMKLYITKRVQSKWAEFEDLTVRENSLSSKEKTNIKEEEKLSMERYWTIMEGIRLLSPFISNHRNTEWDSWLDNWDRYLAWITKKIRDLEFSISESINTVPAIEIEKEVQNVSDLIAKDWGNYVHQIGLIDNFYKPKFKDIFNWTKEQQISAIRWLSKNEWVFDHTESSYLSDEIAAADVIEWADGTLQIKWLEVNDTRINWYLKKIDELLFTKTDFDENWNLIRTNQMAIIDELYNCFYWWDVIEVLAKHGMIPNEDEWKKDSDVKEKAWEIFKIIEQQKRVIEGYNTDMIAKEEAKEKLELEMKSNKTEEEIQRLQALNYLENHPDEAKDIHEKALKKTQDSIKYSGINNIIRKWLMEVFVDKWGGAKWANEDIYNDIVWYWFWDLSDENAKIMGEILVEIAITVVVAVATWWTWAAAMAAILRCWSLAARGARWINLATKISKVIQISQKWYKWLSMWSRAVKLWYRSTSLLLEGTTFNAASTMVHSAIKWTSLDSLNLNPIAKENIQTAAFLWALSIWNSLWMKVITKLHWSTKVTAFSEAGLKEILKTHKWVRTESLVSEAVAMFWAEQGMNFTFGHDVINPETGEVETSRSLQWPTQQERIQMIWMLLAFKAVKPQAWTKIEKRLNDGTLEICRSTKKNEILLRDTKTWKVEKLWGWYDSKYNAYYNWYKRTPEQTKLNNQYKRRERQSKYNEEFNQAKDIIQKIPENLRSESMKKFLEAWDMINLWFHEIKQIQREIGLKWKAVDWILWPKSLKMLREYISQKNWSSESVNNRVKDKATEILHKKFDDLIMSENWITIDGITYKLERRPNEWHNPSHKWRVVYTETWPDWKIKVKVEANSDTFSLPENSNWNNIRERYNAARWKYVDKNLNATLESARHELDWEFTRDIGSRTWELEWKRKARETLEWRKKSLSDEIEWLKSRKAQLEQQLHNISKELTIQPEISSLRDIYSIIREWNKITIGWKKCTFIGVKWDKIIFSEWRWKTKEFSSFKELQDAWVNFNFDIKNRQWDRWLEQQIMFEELVGKEARTKNANEIIRNYEGLKRQKAQIEQDIRDWFFRENAEKLVWKHIWIDGVEYQCTGKNTNNGRTTLDFKKTDWNEHFTISSFEQLKNRWQVNGFGDRYDIIDKDTRAAWRELSEYERKNHDLLRWEGGVGQEPGIFKGEAKYVENKRQALQQVDQQLQRGKADYDNAKLATSPKKVSNPEYERIKNEIDWINSQLIEKWQQLSTIERDLWASDTDISKLEQEIAEITAERNNLSRTERWNDIIDNNWEIERWREEVKEEIERPEEMERKLDELITRTNNWEYENVKLDWVTKKMFEGSVYFEWLSRLFKKNRSFPKKFIKKIWDNFVEMKNKCRETLSEAKKKLVEKWNNFLERKLAEEWDVVEIKEEEINLIENESRINEWNRITEEKLLTEKERLIESMGSDTHEWWRKKRLKNDGTYEPQIEETKDTEWIRRNWTNKVDLANTKFEDLPSDWKMENLKAAEVAIDLVYERLSKWEEITPQILEEMSKIVHNKRLERNWIEWSFENQRVPYERLSESEKAKDRDQILQAIEKVWWREKRSKIEEKFKERRNREEELRRNREEAIEAIEITGYQENIETMDWGRFTWEIKDWQLYKWKFIDKNGNEWYIDKTSEYPVLRYQDKILLDKIWNKESINVGELKRTHRTNFDVLKQIIDSWVIGNEWPRWVQFWWWLWACYWEVAVIMKNSVMNLPPAPSNISKGHWNYDYFFPWQAKNRDWSTFQKNASDFSFHRQAREENPNIDVPYLSIWWKNSNWDFANEVGIEHIEAVMLPAHAKNYPWYSELVKRINEKWIKVIEAPTEENILDYAGWSIILAKDWRRWSFDEAIIHELSKKYPHIPKFEQQVTTYLIETGRISEREIRWKSFAEIREDYIKMATENWFSRWWTRWWQYQNYSSQKNYTKEQQAYFKYIIESRATRESYNYPNPQIKAEIVDEAA